MKQVAAIALGSALAAALLLLAFDLPSAANPTDVNPLRPVDTSSPRATLQGFVTALDDAYRSMQAVLQEYGASGQLYLSPDERQKQIAVLQSDAVKAIKALDLSGIPPILRDAVAPERALQLKEILDRIEVPATDAIPDADAMARSSAKRWRLPGTEIDIALVESGPRAGEYLVTAATVDHLPEFYDRVKKLPYKPGPAAELSKTYRALSGGDTATIYEGYSNSPIGLESIVPTRWMLQLPAWAKAEIDGIAVWQWLGFVVGLAICAGVIYAASRLGRRQALLEDEESGPGWRAISTPLAIILVTAVPVPLLCAILRISGTPLVITTFIQTGALFLAAAWLSVIAAGILAEWIVQSEHLRRRSLDSQLIRLGMRFAGIAIAIVLLIQGAYELGFPAYSVLAGLGVGGLAVALAARDSLANLLGSMLIMIEKPFRVGHLVTVSGTQGTVEDVGFRSTQIRTADNSLVSIPNNNVVNATVENLSLRAMRRQRLLIQVTYSTSREKLELLAERIKQAITEHPLTNKTNLHVRFNDFGESSLNILVIFFIEVADYAGELAAREEILLQIMDLAEELGIDFAFPTRTLMIETPAERQADLFRHPVEAFATSR